MQKLIHPSLLSTFVIILLFGCVNNEPTDLENKTILSGTVTLIAGGSIIRYGFDFSEENVVKIERLNPFNENQEVDRIDLYVSSSSHDTTIHFIGSPVLNVTEDTSANIISVGIQPDSSMPSIMFLDGNNLDEIKKVSESGFELKIKIPVCKIFDNPLFAVKTQDMKYALFEITDFDKYIITIDWKYQSGGSRIFN